MSVGTAKYFMLRALKANMTSREGYVYIFFGTDETVMHKMRNLGSMWLNDAAKELWNKPCDVWKAFESTLVLMSKPPLHSTQIDNDIKKLIKEPPFNSTAFIDDPNKVSTIPMYAKGKVAE